MAHLIYPHLCLFSYVLRDETQNHDERESFKESFVEGTIYRYGRGDTEQCLITSAIGKPEPQSVDVLELLKKTISAKLHEREELGRSWLAFGVLPPGEDPQDVARLIYKELGMELRSQNVDEWQGAKIFETVFEEQHCIVVLYSNLDEMQAMVEAYEAWLYLLQYRHKASWAYQNTRQIKPLLSQHLFPKPSSIMSLTMQDAEVSELDLQNLTQDLKQNLTLLSQYTECLSFLEFQLETVKTNLENYRSRLESMSASGSHSFEGLKQFEAQTGKRYVNQIERDIATLTIGLRVREKTTDTIRGLVELEQAERDRRLEAQSQKFQDSISVLGVGLGSAAIAASFAAAKLEDATIVQSAVKVVPAPMRVSPWAEGAIGVLLCSAIGVLMAVLISLVLFFGKGRKSK